MFKNFWNQKKHIIEMVAIFTALGAIFLAIPIPENEKAEIALFNIHVVWLLIISVSVVVLFLSFLPFAIRVEEGVKRKTRLDLDGSLLLFIFLLIGWLLTNLWQYTFAIYKESLFEFLHSFRYPVGMILFAISQYFVLKLYPYIRRKKRSKKDKKRKLFLFLFLFFGNVVIATLIALLYYSNDIFSLTFFAIITGITSFLFLLGALDLFWQDKKENMVFKKIDKIFGEKIKWAVFGGMAIAIHNGNFYRDKGHRDIDIIIENNENLIRSLFKKIIIKRKYGRKRGYTKIRGFSIDLMFMTDNNEIDLPDGVFKFQSIQKKKLEGVLLPVVDLPSIFEAKIRHKKFLKNKLDTEKDSNKKSKLKKYLKNTKIDIDTIKKIHTKNNKNG